MCCKYLAYIIFLLYIVTDSFELVSISLRDRRGVSYMISYSLHKTLYLTLMIEPVAFLIYKTSERPFACAQCQVEY